MSPQAPGRAAVLVALLVAVATAARAGEDRKRALVPEEPRLVLYASVLQQYAQGDRAGAVQRVGEMSWETLDAAWGAILTEVMRLPTCAGCPDPFARLPLPAAALLHLDRNVFERPRHRDVERAPLCGGRHQDRALDVARLLTSRPTTRPFARRFLLAVTLRAQWDSCLEDAVAVGGVGLELFPGDAELLLAVGASFEKWARLAEVSSPSRLASAQRHLTRAVAADPGLTAARIHLGRVLWRLDRLDEARVALEGALAGDGDARQAYLAHTFLGHVHDRAGRAPEAAAAFRQALAIDPDGQSAAIGLAHVLLRQGEVAGAGQAAEHLLTRPGQRLDPLVNYLVDNALGADERIDALREETRR